MGQVWQRWTDISGNWTPSLTRYVYDGGMLVQEHAWSQTHPSGSYIYVYGYLSRDYLMQPGGIRQKESSDGVSFTDRFLITDGGVITTSIDRQTSTTIKRIELASSGDRQAGGSQQDGKLSNLYARGAYLESYGGGTSGAIGGFDALVNILSSHIVRALPRNQRDRNQSYPTQQSHSNNSCGEHIMGNPQSNQRQAIPYGDNWASDLGLNNTSRQTTPCDYNDFENAKGIQRSWNQYICGCFEESEFHEQFQSRIWHDGYVWLNTYVGTQQVTCWYYCECQGYCHDHWQIPTIPCFCQNGPKNPDYMASFHYCLVLGCSWVFYASIPGGFDNHCQAQTYKLGPCAIAGNTYIRCYRKACPACVKPWPSESYQYDTLQGGLGDLDILED